MAIPVERRWVAAAPLAAALVSVVSACSLVSNPDDALVLEVAEARVSCTGVGPQDCYLVREGSNGELQLFYDEILGFDYTPGYRYGLLVVRSTNDPRLVDAATHSYRLERELWRERSERADLLAATAAAEAKWRAAELEAYDMVQQRICFCGSAGLGSVRLAVTRDDQGGVDVRERVTSIQRVEDGSAVPSEMAHEFLTVQHLFRFIRWSVADDAHRIDVEFDDDLAYPRRISTDRRVEVSDDEVEYIVESVTPGV